MTTGMPSGNPAPDLGSGVNTPRPIDGSPEQLPIGEVLGGAYEIQCVLGHGGMAVVYRGIQKSLKRPVAIKVLNGRFAEDPEFIERFEQEAGALAALSHPNIVGVIDRGHHGRRYYFVMEFVDGETLDQKIIDDSLKPSDWRAMVQACRDALEFVHKRNIVHLDIKPSNVLVDREGRIKLSDFGIAHIITGDGPDVTAGGRPRRPVGTTHYMAPEQTATPDTVDHRADIYALGVSFYKMLTRSMPESGTVLPPSEVNHELPVAVDTVLFRAMAPDRDDRYPSVREFCDDLLKAMKDSSRSLASVIDYRSSDSVSALYSGVDFLTPTSSTAQNVKVKPAAPRPTSTSIRKNLDAATPTGKGTSTKTDLPPTVVPDPAKVAMVRRLLLLVTVLIVFLIAAMLWIMFSPKENIDPHLQVAPLNPSVESPAQRQNRLREEQKAREREALGLPPAGAAQSPVPPQGS